MTQYIGTKIVDAEPAYRITRPGGAQEIVPVATAPVAFDDRTKKQLGYKVVYADGYESFSPKDVFEKHYLPIEVNPDLKTDKPSISQQMVDDFILCCDVQTMGEKCTVVRATLRNGFEIVESSACVSKENYDEQLGAEICLKHIKDKVWMLLGFLLQTSVNGVKCDIPKAEDMSFSLALDAAKLGMRIARKNWNGKGMYVFLASDINFRTEADVSEFEKSGVPVNSMLVLRTAQGTLQPGWWATQSDLLANDWYLV